MLTYTNTQTNTSKHINGCVYLSEVISKGSHYWKLKVLKFNIGKSGGAAPFIIEIANIKDIKSRLNNYCRGYGIMFWASGGRCVCFI